MYIRDPLYPTTMPPEGTNITNLCATNSYNRFCELINFRIERTVLQLQGVFPSLCSDENISLSVHIQEAAKQYPSLKACRKQQNQAFPYDDFLIAWPGLLQVFSRQKSLEADVVRVAVDWGLVGAGLDLLWFL